MIVVVEFNSRPLQIITEKNVEVIPKTVYHKKI
jgi:hypothetical protein